MFSLVRSNKPRGNSTFFKRGDRRIGPSLNRAAPRQFFSRAWRRGNRSAPSDPSTPDAEASRPKFGRDTSVPMPPKQTRARFDHKAAALLLPIGWKPCVIVSLPATYSAYSLYTGTVSSVITIYKSFLKLLSNLRTMHDS